MIKAVFESDKGGFVGFKMSGHAGYADEGEDIACAAVSSAAMLICNTATDFFLIPCKVEAVENLLNLEAEPIITKAQRDILDKLLTSFKSHLAAIDEGFGCIKISEK